MNKQFEAFFICSKYSMSKDDVQDRERKKRTNAG